MSPRENASSAVDDSSSEPTQVPRISSSISNSVPSTPGHRRAGQNQSQRPSPGSEHLVDNVLNHFSASLNSLPSSSPIRAPRSGHSLSSVQDANEVQILVVDGSQSTENKQAGDRRMNSTEIVAKNSLFGIEMPFDVLSAGFALIVAAGGVVGFVKAGSVPSLVAGLTFGSVLGVGTYMTSVNPANYWLTLGTSAVLGSFMG